MSRLSAYCFLGNSPNEEIKLYVHSTGVELTGWKELLKFSIKLLIDFFTSPDDPNHSILH